MEYYKKLCAIKEITELDRDKTDPLKKLYELSISPSRQPLKSLYMIISFVYGLSTLMAFYKLLSAFDYDSVLNYGAMLGIQIFGLEHLYVMMVVFDDIHKYSRDVKPYFFAFQLLDANILSGLTRMVNIIKLITAVNYTLCFGTGTAMILSQDFLNRKIYSRVWFSEHFSPKTCLIAGYLLSLLDFPFIFGIIGLPFLLVYYEMIAIAHIKYMNELIKTICSTSLPEDELNESEVFQQIVTEKLKICITLHQIILGITAYGRTIIYGPLLLILFGSLILWTSLILFILALDLNHMGPFAFAVQITTVTYATSVWFYIYFSQLLKNESELSRDLLVQLPWYYMNIKNRQLYHICLIKSETPVTIQIDILEVNYLVLVRLFKILYSIATILLHFKSNIH